MIVCILERFLLKFHGEWIVSGRPIQKQLKKLVEDFHGGSGLGLHTVTAGVLSLAGDVPHVMQCGQKKEKN